jgi:hypothetical protein
VEGSGQDDVLRNCVEAVTAVVTDEPVISAAPFFRRGLYTNKALGRLGALPYLLGRAQSKAQAGGLPQNFMVAITPTKVRAFHYKAHGRRRNRYEIGEEVAAWDRATIRVSWQKGGPYQTDVTIEPPEGGERIECRVGRAPYSEEFLRIMSDPGAS